SSTTVLPPCGILFSSCSAHPRHLHSFPTRRSSDLSKRTSPPATYAWPRSINSWISEIMSVLPSARGATNSVARGWTDGGRQPNRSEEHTSELQSRENLVCRLLLEKKKQSTHATPAS